MTTAALIYPHQLFPNQPTLAGAELVFLVEDPLFFTQYPFHRQKLVFHRASMTAYAKRLQEQGYAVRAVRSTELDRSDRIGAVLSAAGVTAVQVCDVVDDWLERRLQAGLGQAGIAVRWLPDPHFLTPMTVWESFVAKKRKLFFTEFYIQQRKRLKILLEADESPIGGAWSFDPENRRKLPRGLAVPACWKPRESAAAQAARRSVAQEFPSAPGPDGACPYPTTSAEARRGLDDFLDHRLPQFGDYEDAIARDQRVLFHSVLTPALNSGLLAPRDVVDAALERSETVPINSLEGFVRQIIGWREFIRGVYVTHGRQQRTRNFWGFSRKMPGACYTATTGIEPVDTVIRRVLATGYCHHIERLMILGNFFLLCEIDPDEVYRWFMELFIDAYDWVMVPNVYGMSQHADGGMITTKPYLSGSAYVLKMSDFGKGPWCPIWDALYWRFIDRQRAFFAGNPRMAVMVGQLDRMGSRLAEHRRTADAFLEQLD